jgi:hypothetical protein
VVFVAVIVIVMRRWSKMRYSEETDDHGDPVYEQVLADSISQFPEYNSNPN